MHLKNEQKEIVTEQQFSNAWNLGPHGMIYHLEKRLFWRKILHVSN